VWPYVLINKFGWDSDLALFPLITKYISPEAISIRSMCSVITLVHSFNLFFTANHRLTARSIELLVHRSLACVQYIAVKLIDLASWMFMVFIVSHALV